MKKKRKEKKDFLFNIRSKKHYMHLHELGNELLPAIEHKILNTHEKNTIKFHLKSIRSYISLYYIVTHYKYIIKWLSIFKIAFFILVIYF